MLTDNCEIEFKTWYNKEFENRNLPYMNGFEISDLSIRYGVYVDFFDSVGIKIYIEPIIDKYFVSVMLWNKVTNTRQESREQAINKANEIFNNLK